MALRKKKKPNKNQTFIQKLGGTGANMEGASEFVMQGNKPNIKRLSGKHFRDQNSDKFDDNILEKRTLILGSTTSVLLALELNIEVLHICAYDIIEAFSNDIWNTIEVNEIYPQVYKYNLKNKNEIIRLSNNTISFNNYISLWKINI